MTPVISTTVYNLVGNYDCAPYPITDSETTCPICMDPLEGEAIELHPSKRQGEQAPHLFHENCLSNTFRIARTLCPLCRTPVHYPQATPAPAPVPDASRASDIVSPLVRKIAQTTVLVAFILLTYLRMGKILFFDLFVKGMLMSLCSIPLIAAAAYYKTPFFPYEDRWNACCRFAQIYLPYICSITEGELLAIVFPMPALSMTLIRNSLLTFHVLSHLPTVYYVSGTISNRHPAMIIFQKLASTTFCTAFTIFTALSGQNHRWILGVLPLGMGTVLGFNAIEKTTFYIVDRFRQPQPSQ